jgi:hypothetical protein
MMFDLTPQDDLTHATGKEETWHESFSFDFFDPTSRLSGFGRINAQPNRQAGDCVFALWRDDILLAKFTKWDFHLPQDIGEERMEFGPLAFRTVAAFKTAEISYDDGYCRLDLAFDSIHPPYSWLQSHAGLVPAAPGSHHYQQQGRYHGVARVGRESFPILAVGARDHGWGPMPQRGLGFRRWISASAQFSERLAFQTLLFAPASGPDLLFGYLFRGAHNELVRGSRVSVVYAAHGAAPSGCNLELAAENGERVSAAVRLANAFNTSFQEPQLPGFRFSCAAEFHMDGQAGYGRLHSFWASAKERRDEWEIAPPATAPVKLSKFDVDPEETVF